MVSVYRVVPLGLPQAGAHIAVTMRDLPYRGDDEADGIGEHVGEHGSRARGTW